jgi:hypothetical protein
MIRRFFDVKTKREIHIHAESEEFGVLTGHLCCDAEKLILVEVAPGIWEQRKWPN